MIPLNTLNTLWPKIEFAGDHWLWLGAVDRDGHGVCRIAGDRRKRRVHRVVWEVLIGPIPDALVLDHVCRVRQCCNPAHLQPVTNAENVKRRAADDRTHCPKGHPYDEANTRYRIKDGYVCRTCRTCDRAARRRRRAEKKGGRPGTPSGAP